MTKLLQVLRDLSRSTSGNTLVFAGFVFTVLIGAAGLATDTVQWTLWQRQLQREADSAALSGALSNAQGGSGTTAATTELGRYSLITLSAAPTIEVGPSTGPYAGNTKAVRVTLQAKQVLPFSSFFMKTPPTVRAEATAAAVSFGNYCVISLEKTSATGVTFQGSSSVTMGCGVASNSQGAQAIYGSGSSYISASPVAAVGGIPSSSNYAAGTVLIPHTIAQPDPFASLPTPTIASCKPQLTVGPNTTASVSNPTGVVCYQGMNLKGTVTFDPGIYIIDGSKGNGLDIGSQAQIAANGVTFVLSTSSSDMSTVATVNMNGTATITMTAPTSGTFAGVFLYQDRRALLGPNNYLTGNSGSTFQGAVYMPAQELEMTGNSGMNTDCLQLIARQITFIGNNSIANVCPSNGASHAIAGAQIRLVN